MRRPAILSVTVALLFGAGHTALADDGAPWRPDGVWDGLQVERREVAGSSFDELRISTVSTLALARLCEALFPRALRPTLDRQYKKRELLRQTDTERWIYEQISVPVFSDRDYVVHAKLELPASTGRCSVSFANEDDPSRPPVPGFVRIPALRGRWDAFPLGDGKLSIQYRLFTDPGGGVPAFLSRRSQRNAALDFVRTTLARAAALAAP